MAKIISDTLLKMILEGSKRIKSPVFKSRLSTNKKPFFCRGA